MMVTRLHALGRHNLRVQLMGIVNRTPDSFFDGGVYVEDDIARVRVDQLLAEGVDIIDVGAESSRPGAPVVAPADQIARLGDIIPFACARARDGWVHIGNARAAKPVVVSLDTTSPAVAEHAVAQGARMINSISLSPAKELAKIAAKADATLVLTHCRASTNDMADFSAYDNLAYRDLIHEVVEEWRAAAAIAQSVGLSAERIIFDPGLGFTKNGRQSLELAREVRELKRRVAPHRVLIGASRKSYIAHCVAAHLGDAPPSPENRLGGSIAAALDAAAQGADILRVHDVAIVRQALAYVAAVSHSAGEAGAGV
jgi:dihydropteroate synthase